MLWSTSTVPSNERSPTPPPTPSRSTQKAVTAYRELAAAYPDRYRACLARSLSSLRDALAAGRVCRTGMRGPPPLWVAGPCMPGDGCSVIRFAGWVVAYVGGGGGAAVGG